MDLGIVKAIGAKSNRTGFDRAARSVARKRGPVMSFKPEARRLTPFAPSVILMRESGISLTEAAAGAPIPQAKIKTKSLTTTPSTP